jgi:hypothetical protein
VTTPLAVDFSDSDLTNASNATNATNATRK